ncbi:MAG: AtpZ/AtpI family protein [Phycisphaeraceae bacterium]
MTREPKYKSMFGTFRPQDLRALGIGLELSMVIGGMAWGGYWLDGKLGTEPWLLMTGVCVGILGGGWHAMKMANDGKLPDFGFKPKNKPPANEQAQDDNDANADDPKP